MAARNYRNGMLAGIRIHLGRETDWSLLPLGVAGWMRYVSGVDDAGNAIDVRDPLSDKIRELVAGSSSEQRVTALLSLREISVMICQITRILCRSSNKPGNKSHNSARIRRY